MLVVIQEEAEWRRVANFVVFLHTGQLNLVDYCRCVCRWLKLCFIGGLSSVDWSIRWLGGGGSMPPTEGTATAHSDITLSVRQSKVLENRDLCRIVGSYIPKLL